MAIWDMDNDGLVNDISVWYDDGSYNGIAQAAGYWQNCTQKFTTPIMTAAGPDGGRGLLTNQKAVIRAGDFNNDNKLNQIAVYGKKFTTGVGYPTLAIVDWNGNSNWNSTALGANAQSMEVGEFLADAGTDILSCSLTGPTCYILNGTGSTKVSSSINFMTATQSIMPHGLIGGNSYESFLRRQTSSLANMTTSNLGYDWVAAVNITSQSAVVGNFDGNGDDDFCFEAKDGAQYKIYCLNNSGSIIGNWSVQNQMGNVWGKGCMKTMNKENAAYDADLIVACDTNGTGYLFTLMPELKEGLVSAITGDTPFFTNSTNPINVTLSKDTCQNVTFWVNATGETNSKHLFYAYANISNYMSISNKTAELNITIV